MSLAGSAESPEPQGPIPPAAGGQPAYHPYDKKEDNAAYHKELAAVAAQIDPKLLSLVMQLIGRDVWAKGLFRYLPACVVKALNILEALDNVFQEDSWEDWMTTDGCAAGLNGSMTKANMISKTC